MYGLLSFVHIAAYHSHNFLHLLVPFSENTGTIFPLSLLLWIYDFTFLFKKDTKKNITVIIEGY